MATNSNEDIIQSNLLLLENSNVYSTSSKRRIKRECEMLYETYSDLVLSYNNNGKIEMEITENKNKYKFIFNNSFPFLPPQIYYNGDTYLEALRLKCDFQKKMVKKYKNKDCLCCESYSCHDNWAPSVKLSDVIEEIKCNINFKKTMMNVLIADKIKRKYLIDDVDINSYLI